MQVKPDIMIVFMNSGYDLPDLYETRDRVLKEWRIENYTEIPSPIDYISLLEQYGMRNINRTEEQQKEVVQLIKKDNIAGWARKEGYDGFFWGMRCDESVGRKIYLRKNGAIHAIAGITRVSPLMNWSNDDVWQFINEVKIPYPAFYDKTDLITKKEIRSSGWLTTDGAHRGRIIWLKTHYPIQYHELLRRFPEVKQYV
jgi:phosphoadenosine phosphosulfate reductase